jgi:hypothetical protein
LPGGEALVSWITPPDDGPAGTLGFFVTINGRPLPRELIPLAVAPGGRVEAHLRDLKLTAGASVDLAIQAVDAAGNRGPAASARLTVSNRRPAGLPPLKSDPERPSRGTTMARVAGLRWRFSMSSTRSTRRPAQ